MTIKLMRREGKVNVVTAIGEKLWSIVTQIFHNGRPAHDSVLLVLFKWELCKTQHSKTIFTMKNYIENTYMYISLIVITVSFNLVL